MGFITVGGDCRESTREEDGDGHREGERVSRVRREEKDDSETETKYKKRVEKNCQSMFIRSRGQTLKVRNESESQTKTRLTISYTNERVR